MPKGASVPFPGAAPWRLCSPAPPEQQSSSRRGPGIHITISRPPALMSMLPLVLRATCRVFKIGLGEGGLMDFIYFVVLFFFKL